MIPSEKLPRSGFSCLLERSTSESGFSGRTPPLLSFDSRAFHEHELIGAVLLFGMRGDFHALGIRPDFLDDVALLERRQVLAADPMSTRPVVSKPLAGRVAFTPPGERDRWDLRGHETLVGLFSVQTAIAAWQRTPKALFQPRLRARRCRTDCLKAFHASSLYGPWKARQIEKTITRTTTHGATLS